MTFNDLYNYILEDVNSEVENAAKRLIRSAIESGLKPIKPREEGALRGFYTFQAKDGGSKIAFSSGTTIAEENPNELTIEAIYTPPKKRGSGSASNLLSQIISIADKTNITLKLEPKSISALAEEGDVFLTKKQLASWYKRHGFKQENEGFDDILVRIPTTSDTEK